MHSAQAGHKSAAKSGRRAAGQDPVKRNQILDGAKRCFLGFGFALTSMSQITAEAGVSKGTIYVYFADKEGLFKALIEREKSAVMSAARHKLEEGGTVAVVLQRFGVYVAARMTSEEIVRAQRMVLGVIEQMPEIAKIFYGGDTFSAHLLLKEYFDDKVAAGELVIADTDLAARQFLDLSMASNFKRRLFGNLPDPLPLERIESLVATAVEMFLTFYDPHHIRAADRASENTRDQRSASESASG